MAARTFWRIVRSNPPDQRSFLSHAALGIPVQTLNAEAVRQSEGVSVFATESQARRPARRHPALGAWLAELRLTEDTSVEIARTRGAPGHHTIWGDPDVLLACVGRVVAV